MALIALKQYDLDVKRVRLLTNETNGIFRVDTENSQKYMLRVTDPLGSHGLDEIRSEAMWLEALRRDTDLGVPKPLTTRTGSFATTVELESVPEARHCGVFTWIPGVDLAERLTAANMYNLGELTARLHDHAQTFIPPEGFRVRKLDKVFLYADPDFPNVEPIVVFDERYDGFFPPERRAIFRRSVDRVQGALDDLFRDKTGLRITHNDLHQWNVKVHRGKIYTLDFEDLAWGYPVQDIATTLYYFQEHEQRGVLVKAYKRGYTSLNEWPEQYPGQIETFIAGRDVMLANYLLCSNNLEDQAMAPDYIARVERRLRSWLTAHT
jgi:Ser/Thr protein kinase RdoA (MazF antagonist)